jgi:hypothetical protein
MEAGELKRVASKVGRSGKDQVVWKYLEEAQKLG